MEIITAELLAEHMGRTRVLREYRVLPVVNSTNTYLRERDAEEGLVVLTDHQTAGRGRQGRTWTVPPGSSIECSVLLRPPLPAHDLYLVTAACALAMRDAVAPVLSQPAELKWPNDLLIRGRKAGGILTEVELSAGRDARVIVGFGLNVHAAPAPELVEGATCVAAHASRPVTRLGILSALLRAYDRMLHELYSGGAEEIWPRWRAALCTLGKLVQVRTPTGQVHGRAVDVARDGGLILEIPDSGTRQVVYAGDAIEQPSQV